MSSVLLVTGGVGVTGGATVVEGSLTTAGGWEVVAAGRLDPYAAGLGGGRRLVDATVGADGNMTPAMAVVADRRDDDSRMLPELIVPGSVVILCFRF
jgi:hypothetical protein